MIANKNMIANKVSGAKFLHKDVQGLFLQGLYWRFLGKNFVQDLCRIFLGKTNMLSHAEICLHKIKSFFFDVFNKIILGKLFTKSPEKSAQKVSWQDACRRCLHKVRVKHL